MGSLGESTFGDPLWAEASRVSVQNVSKMWLPRVPDGFLFQERYLLKKGVPWGVWAVFGHFVPKKIATFFFSALRPGSGL